MKKNDDFYYRGVSKKVAAWQKKKRIKKKISLSLVLSG